MPTLAFTTLTDLAAQIRSGQISPVAVTRHILHRIAQHDPTPHPHVTVMRGQALAIALVLALWWLMGPVARWWHGRGAQGDFAEALAARA